VEQKILNILCKLYEDHALYCDENDEDGFNTFHHPIYNLFEAALEGANRLKSGILCLTSLTLVFTVITCFPKCLLGR